jgi:hypothetical protein
MTSLRCLILRPAFAFRLTANGTGVSFSLRDIRAASKGILLTANVQRGTIWSFSL